MGGGTSCPTIPEGYYGTGGESTTRTGYTQCNSSSSTCTYYCTSGSRYSVGSGYYVSSYGATGDCRTASGQTQCGSSTYCISGKEYSCPSHTHHFSSGETSIHSCFCTVIVYPDPYRPNFNIFSGYANCDDDLSSNGCESSFNYSTLTQKPNYEICCGDGYCSSANGENSSNCGADCVSCGDGICSLSENKFTCPSDCQVLLPPDPNCRWDGAYCVADGDCPQSIDDRIVCCGSTCCPEGSCLRDIYGGSTCNADCRLPLPL